MHMSGSIFKKHVLLSASVIYWICGLLLLQAFATNRSELIAAEQQEEVRREVALVRSKLEAKVFENIYKADSLASILTIDPIFGMAHWDELAQKLIQSTPYVRNLGVAPDNIIRQVYPIQGNEKALGFDFRTNPKQYASVLKAQELGSVYLDGPLELVQGGQAIIARFPIFRDFPINQDYWGTVSIVLDYTQLLKSSGISQLNNVSIAMQRLLPYSSEPITFYGSDDIFTKPDFNLPILLPNSQWQLAGRFMIKAPDMSLIYVLGLAGTGLFYISLMILIRAYRLSHCAALQDELTRLPNRRYMMSHLKRSASENPKRGFALLNIDLNDFKKVNDEYGHEIGDQLLQHIAHQLLNTVAKPDVVSRVGGDEFLITLEDISDNQQAEDHAKKIKKHLTKNPFSFVSTRNQSSEKHVITPSLSIGFALFDPKAPVSIEKLLNTADLHMYQEKETKNSLAN